MLVFTVTFVVAATVIRYIFVTILDQQMNMRLQVLARAGLRSTLTSTDHLSVDKREIANTRLLAEGQGLQWYDVQGRLLASEGMTPSVQSDQTSLHRPRGEATNFVTVAIPIVDPKSRGFVGTVRASETLAERAERIRWFDVGLLIGTLLAVLGGGIAGLVLTRTTVRPVARAFETLRDFTADASHELRGPLTAIAANADAALRDTDMTADNDRPRFQAIADSAKHLCRLTNDLLLIANADKSLKRDLFAVDINSLLDSLVSRYRPQFDASGISISLALVAGTVVYGNPDQIERILANVIENALRYSLPGGSVLIHNERHRTQVSVVVHDTGIGIAPEHLDRVFDRFWRAAPSRSSGSGLGLAIARALARRHGGDVTVSSQLGVGSEFVISLPTRPSNVD